MAAKMLPRIRQSCLDDGLRCSGGIPGLAEFFAHQPQARQAGQGQSALNHWRSCICLQLAACSSGTRPPGEGSVSGDTTQQRVRTQGPSLAAAQHIEDSIACQDNDVPTLALELLTQAAAGGRSRKSTVRFRLQPGDVDLGHGRDLTSDTARTSRRLESTAAQRPGLLLLRQESSVLLSQSCHRAVVRTSALLCSPWHILASLNRKSPKALEQPR